MAFLRRSYITCMLWARRRTCLCRLKLLQLASFSTLAPSVLGNLSWSFANLKKTSRAFALRAGTSLVEYCYVLLKFAQAPLRLDRIVIQLFVMLGHYLQVFLLLFLVEEEQSLSRAIFGIKNLRQTVSRNCFERKERDSCRRDPCTFTLVAPQHLSAIAVATLA